MLHGASITDASIALRKGFVYCVFAPRFRAAYVGQTCGGFGALGRLGQHLADGGTFRKRLCENFGYEDVDIGPIVFEAFQLDFAQPEFHERVRDYREAVEAIVQFELLNLLARDRAVPCVVVSRVALNGYVRASFVRTAASAAVERIYERAKILMGDSTWGAA